MVYSHCFAVLPAASAAASAAWPKCLTRVRLRRCSRQIPVSPETSSSVKIFWLDRIVRVLIVDPILGPLLTASYFQKLVLAIVLPFHYAEFLMREGRKLGSEIDLDGGRKNCSV